MTQDWSFSTFEQPFRTTAQHLRPFRTTLDRHLKPSRVTLSDRRPPKRDTYLYISVTSTVQLAHAHAGVQRCSQYDSKAESRLEGAGDHVETTAIQDASFVLYRKVLVVK